MSLFVVPVSHASHVWDQGASCLAESCVTDDETADQLKMILSRGDRYLVQVKRCDGGTVGWGAFRIDQLPNVRVLHITNLVAHNGGFDQFFEEIKALASAHGCSRIRCSCSAAHARLYKMKCGLLPVFSTIEIKI